MAEWDEDMAPEDALREAAETLHAENAALRAEVERLREALRECERWMAYFSWEIDGYFEGGGMPKDCLAMIRAALAPEPSA